MSTRPIRFTVQFDVDVDGVSESCRERAETITRFSPNEVDSASVDLPTFGRPTMASLGMKALAF